MRHIYRLPIAVSHDHPLTQILKNSTETNAYGCGSQSQRQAYPIASTSPHIRHCFPCQHVRLRGKNHKKMQRKNENLPLQKGSRLRKSKYQSKMRCFLSDKSPVVPMKSAKLFPFPISHEREKIVDGDADAPRWTPEVISEQNSNVPIDQRTTVTPTVTTRLVTHHPWKRIKDVWDREGKGREGVVYKNLRVRASGGRS